MGANGLFPSPRYWGLTETLPPTPGSRFQREPRGPSEPAADEQERLSQVQPRGDLHQLVEDPPDRPVGVVLQTPVVDPQDIQARHGLAGARVRDEAKCQPSAVRL